MNEVEYNQVTVILDGPEKAAVLALTDEDIEAFGLDPLATEAFKYFRTMTLHSKVPH